MVVFDGVFQNFEGEVVSEGQENKIKLQLDIYGKSRPVEVDRKKIRKRE